jgi:hypothetical protein
MCSFSVLANKHLNWSSEKENEKKKGKKSKVISTTDVARRIYERESEILYPSSPFFILTCQSSISMMTRFSLMLMLTMSRKGALLLINQYLQKAKKAKMWPFEKDISTVNHIINVLLLYYTFKKCIIIYDYNFFFTQ